MRKCERRAYLMYADNFFPCTESVVCTTISISSCISPHSTNLTVGKFDSLSEILACCNTSDHTEMQF